MNERQFPATRWTLIQQAQGLEDSPGRVALGELCQIYWYPVYAQVRFRGRSPQDAEDLTQGFFALLLEQRAFDQVSSAKGKFRSYLLKALTHFLANDYRRATTLKRGGGQVILSLDQTQAEERWLAEPVTSADPCQVYELTWARTVIQNSLRQLEREHHRDTERERLLFLALRDRLLDSPSPKVTKAIASRFGLTDGAVRLAAFRMRRRLAKLLKLEILQTLSDPSEIDEEINYLMNLFSEKECG